MAIRIHNYFFTGPYQDLALIHEQSGILVILIKSPKQSTWQINSIAAHPNIKQACQRWQRTHRSLRQQNTVGYAVLYCHEYEQTKVLSTIKQGYRISEPRKIYWITAPDLTDWIYA